MAYTRSYSQWFDWPNVSTPITAAAMQNIENGLSVSLGSSFNALAYGADPTGISDSGPSILSAVQAAWNASPVGSVYVPAGNYKIATPVDFTTLTLGAGLNGWQFICDAGTTFVDATTSGPVINLTPPSGLTAVSCIAKLGVLSGRGIGATASTGAVVLGWHDCEIDIGWVNGFNGSGLKMPAATATQGVLNNRVYIKRLSSCVTGLDIVGGAGSFGTQGNLFHIAQAISCTNGVVLDSAGTGKNSFFNRFIVQAEVNTNDGILDNNGAAWWDITYSGGNTNADYEIPAGAAGVPVVRGFITGTIKRNFHIADLCNYSVGTGSVTPPAVPASGSAAGNTFARPVHIYVNGGTVSSITLGGVATGATSGMFRLMPGEAIVITYTVAPTWTWFLTD